MSGEKNPDRNTPKLGIAIALGAGFGAVLFTATDSAVWIGVGVALGAALGSAWERG